MLLAHVYKSKEFSRDFSTLVENAFETRIDPKIKMIDFLLDKFDLNI